MSQYFRVEIAQPATRTTAAKQWVWTPVDNIVEAIDVELRKEGKLISNLTVTIYDQKKSGQMWPITNALPDPAFSDVPIKVFIAKPSEGQAASRLVFEGKITSLQPAWPGPSNLTIVAHSRSIDMRLKALYRTIKNKTSVQTATTIAQEYGYTVDTSELVGIVLGQRLIDMGAGSIGLGAFSDWNHIVRALAADGLELYVVGKTIRIRQRAQKAYPHLFTPDDGITFGFQPTINHVSGPGAGGQSHTPVPAGNKGTVSSAQGSRKTEADAQKADETTHRTTPQGPDSKSMGAHTESPASNKGPSVQRRRRKDEASLTCRALPDMGLQHTLNLSGWGGKFDGTWYITSLKHNLAGSSAATSSVSLTREPSNAAQKQIGIQPGGTNS